MAYSRGPWAVIPIKFQIANGVGLAIMFLIVSDFLKSNSSEIFSEIESWQTSPRQHRLLRFRVPFTSPPPPPNIKLTSMIPEGGLKWLICTQNRNHHKDSLIWLLCPVKKFLWKCHPYSAKFKHLNTEKNMWDTNPFCILQVLDGIAGKVRNVSRLKKRNNLGGGLLWEANWHIA
jgi:hypothetical protein